MVGRRVAIASVLVATIMAVTCGYPQPERVTGGGLGPDETGDGGIALIDEAPPDAPEIDAIPIDAPPDAPAGYVGTPPTAGTASLSGAADVGSVLTATPSGFGLGDPPAGYHYIWQRCTTSGCSSITAIGADTNKYTLVTADGGKYIRVGIYASNACANNCGMTSTVFSAAKGPVRRVILAKGDVCHPDGCQSSACRTYKVSLVGFSTASHTVTCNASNTNNPWFTYSTSTFPSERCCYGFSDKKTWVTVDGLKSNVVTW
jgi:hypothetical protein